LFNNRWDESWCLDISNKLADPKKNHWAGSSGQKIIIITHQFYGNVNVFSAFKTRA